jgi:hypothetical protein
MNQDPLPQIARLNELMQKRIRGEEWHQLYHAIMISGVGSLQKSFSETQAKLVSYPSERLRNSLQQLEATNLRSGELAQKDEERRESTLAMHRDRTAAFEELLVAVRRA